MTDDKNYRFALLERIQALLDQHGRAIAGLEERLARHDVLYGEAITALHERFDAHDLWVKDVLAVLKEMRDAANKDVST
jgi:hypothetical protein